MREKQRLLIVVTLLLCVQLLFSGTTGKIAGKITDADNNQPLAGANVVIEGTYMGAATDMDGNFVILNIPPGIYNVKVSMMGYEPALFENLRLRIDMTTEVNASLKTQAIEAETVQIIAAREMIQKDKTSTMAAVNAQEIESLPVQSINQVLQLQAGVVQSGNNTHVRGGRDGELNYMVDGVSVTTLGGGRGLNIETEAVQEMQLISGTFNAEHGRAMSGILNIVTKEGSKDYHGQIDASLGDYVSGSHVYEIMTDYEAVTDPETGKLRNVATTENPLSGLNPQWDIRGNLTGPVPFTKNKLTFFTNGRYQNSEGWRYGKKWYLPVGLPGDSSTVPLQPSESYSIQNKLTFSPNANFKINYGFYYNQNDQPRNTGRGDTYVADGSNQSYSSSRTHIFTLNHTLSAKTFYEAKVARFSNESESYLYKDINKVPDYFIRITKADGTQEDRYYESEDEKKQILDYITNQESWQYEYVIDPANPIGYADPLELGTTPPASFSRNSMPRGHSYNSSSYWLGKFDITSQINQTHLLKAGVEYITHEYNRERFTLRGKLDENNNEIKPFVPSIPDISTTFHDKYTREPREFYAYLQDKMEYQDFIMNIGVRLDYFDSNWYLPVDPEDPDIYTPISNTFKYKDWKEPETALNHDELEAYIEEQGFVEYTPDERRAIMHKKVKAKYQISPRIGISYPITDRGTIHFSYGHFFQKPSAGQLYANPDYKIMRDAVWGNPDLNAEKTVQYEIGLQQQLSDNITIDVTAFYKDIRDWVTSNVPWVDTKLGSYIMYDNGDYANVRGITVMLDKRFSNGYSAGLDYSLMFAEATYSDAGDAYGAIKDNREPARALTYTGYDRRHSLHGTLSYRAYGWTATLIGELNTGLPYTPQPDARSTLKYIGWKQNIARRPTLTSVDLRLERELIKIAGLTNRIYIRVYNLLDQKGATSVYADTGSPAYDTGTTHELIPYNAGRVGSLEQWLLNPGRYQGPREVQVGLKVSF